MDKNLNLGEGAQHIEHHYERGSPVIAIIAVIIVGLISISSLLLALGVFGAAGKQGPLGPQGIQGPAGTQGQRGEMGVQGLKGDRGDTGPAGPTGPSGGPPGPQGLKGDKGDTGPADPAPSREQMRQVAIEVLNEYLTKPPTGASTQAINRLTDLTAKVIASDDFESGQASGGKGWDGPWILNRGEITKRGTPYSGEYHLVLNGGGWWSQRAFSHEGSKIRVTFAVKLSGSYTEAHMRIGGQKIWTWNKDDPTDQYKLVDLDLSSYSFSMKTQIEFYVANETLYIDNLQIIALPPK